MVDTISKASRTTLVILSFLSDLAKAFPGWKHGRSWSVYWRQTLTDITNKQQIFLIWACNLFSDASFCLYRRSDRLSHLQLAIHIWPCLEYLQSTVNIDCIPLWIRPFLESLCEEKSCNQTCRLEGPKIEWRKKIIEVWVSHLNRDCCVGIAGFRVQHKGISLTQCAHNTSLIFSWSCDIDFHDWLQENPSSFLIG